MSRKKRCSQLANYYGIGNVPGSTVTAATITDAMIEQLQNETAELLGKFPECTVIALCKPTGRDRRAQHKKDREAKRYLDARIACAALWNERHGQSTAS